MLALAVALGLGYQAGAWADDHGPLGGVGLGAERASPDLSVVGMEPGFGMVQVLPEVNSNFWGGLLLTFFAVNRRHRRLISAGSPCWPWAAQQPAGHSRVQHRVYRGPCAASPLVTILFMAQIMLPLFLPEGMRIDRVLRAMAGIVIFSAAYMAENVRGGLQAVPEGAG